MGRTSGPRHIKIRDEELLALDLVTRDGVLALSRNQPINERLAQLRLHMRVLGGVHQDYVILVEQALVALNHDIKPAAALERDPGAAIRKHISVRSGGGVERGLHAPTDLLAPKAFVFCDVDASGFPEIKLLDVRARAIATRDERGSLRLDGLQSRHDVAHALDAGWVAFRADQDEVVIHHRIKLHAEAVGDELLLLRLGMHENDIGIAPPGRIERLPGALSDDTHIDAGFRLEQWKDVTEQPRVL